MYIYYECYADEYRLAMVGTEWNYPAWSCEEIASLKPKAASGWYWVKPNQDSQSVLVYCEFGIQSGSSRKGWTRVLHINMSDPQQQCPTDYFRLVTQDRLRVCGRYSGADCQSVHAVTGFTYRRVCGRVVGYVAGSVHGFFKDCPRCTLDSAYLESAYVDGFSVTYGDEYHRKHVWSFGMYTQGTCGRPAGTMYTGQNFYCERPTHKTTNRIYTRDPLFAGKQFCVELPEPTSEPLEFRICANEAISDGDALLQYLALYIQ